MENGVIISRFRENLKKYSDDFSSGKLWEKLKESASKLGLQAVYSALQLYYLTLDPKVPLADKAIITAALGYLILPFDIMPDFVPGGLLDDGVILGWALKQMADAVTDETRAQALAKLRDWFPNADLSDIDDRSTPVIKDSVAARHEADAPVAKIAEGAGAPSARPSNNDNMTIYIPFEELTEYVQNHYGQKLSFSRKANRELHIEYEKKVLFKNVGVPVNIVVDEVRPDSVVVTYNGNALIDTIIGGALKYLMTKSEFAAALRTLGGRRIAVELSRIPKAKGLVEALALRDIDVLEDSLRITASLK